MPLRVTRDEYKRSWVGWSWVTLCDVLMGRRYWRRRAQALEAKLRALGVYDGE